MNIKSRDPISVTAVFGHFEVWLVLVTHGLYDAKVDDPNGGKSTVWDASKRSFYKNDFVSVYLSAFKV